MAISCIRNKAPSFFPAEVACNRHSLLLKADLEGFYEYCRTLAFLGWHGDSSVMSS